MLSYYRFLARYTAYECTFEEAFERDGYLRDTARYATHVRRWQNVFGSKRVLVTFYEDLLGDAQTFLNQICDFTGIKRFELGKQREPIMSGQGHRMPAYPLLTRLASAVSAQVQKLGGHGLVEVLRRAGVGRLFYDNGEPFLPMSQETDQRLRTELRSEIEELEGIVGRDLSKWKTGVRSEVVRAPKATWALAESRSSQDGTSV
jgi:hypothetical protein